MKKIIKWVKALRLYFFRFSASDLPQTLITKNDFELVLNRYLLDYWEMKHESIDGFEHLTIQNHLPLNKKRFENMKQVISERKFVMVYVHYI